MIEKILITNRSEIACRIIRACKELDIKTVAVYSEIDENSLHVELADESVLIGPAPASESYLNQEAIINAAKSTNADAIHPGYGFLSENSEFNKKVRKAGLIFIGPEPEPMDLMGSKTASRNTMQEAGVPVIPGFQSDKADIKKFKEEAKKIGFPVLVKASAGGGGKGMRVVREEAKFEEAFEAAGREAKSSFGDATVFVEKYIEKPRHIEFQVAGDKHGNYLHFYERECSIQRRHQKIIEETPSTAMTPELREKMGQAAIEAVKAVNYDSVGTVEFLLDEGGSYYFLEVNTRIQVEHPITEMTTGIDLVKLQIEVADGKEFELKQDDISQRGHSLECRVYAEDAENNFMPTGGKVLFLKEPKGSGIRYDSGIKEGIEISPFYDPIMAKLISHGSNREEAIKRMRIALKEQVILGVKTSTDFLYRILDTKDFTEGNTYTDFIDNNLDDLLDYEDDINFALAAATQSNKKKREVSSENGQVPLPWQVIGKWEIGGMNKLT